MVLDIIEQFQIGLGLLGAGVTISIAIFTKVYMAGKSKGKETADTEQMKLTLSALEKKVDDEIAISKVEHTYIRDTVSAMRESYEKRLDGIKSLLDIMRGEMKVLIKHDD